MNVVIVIESHFLRTPDGNVWTRAAFAHDFWKRYLEVFDGVRVVARVRDVAEPPSQHVRADGPGVSFTAVPDYLGPWQYLTRVRNVVRAVRSAVATDDAVILRVPSQLANCLAPAIYAARHPYAVEVVGDPWDVFGPHAVRHPLRPLLRRYSSERLKLQCERACGAAYVTDRILQQRYPVAKGRLAVTYSSIELSNVLNEPLSVGVSDVELTAQSHFAAPSHPLSNAPMLRMIQVGTLSQLYKGQDVAIEALAQCRKKGLDAVLTFVGDGKFRSKLENLAARLHVQDHVKFLGELPQGEAVQRELDRSDLFILPSLCEGLPRALIEAMARGLPCIASTVGGIPELLPAEDLVLPGSATALTGKILEVAASPARRSQMSARNLRRAMDFRDDVLREKRRDFYRFVRKRTEQWLKSEPAMRRCA
jgi:glycosyltransferase involved in cell wall biosynthesis